MIIFQLNIIGTCFIIHAHTFVIIITGIARKRDFNTRKLDQFDIDMS